MGYQRNGGSFPGDVFVVAYESDRSRFSYGDRGAVSVGSLVMVEEKTGDCFHHYRVLATRVLPDGRTEYLPHARRVGSYVMGRFHAEQPTLEERALILRGEPSCFSRVVDVDVLEQERCGQVNRELDGILDNAVERYTADLQRGGA